MPPFVALASTAWIKAIFRVNEDGWQELLRMKYLKNKTIGEVYIGIQEIHTIEQALQIKIKDRFLDFSTFKINNGSQTRFWKDKWLENFSLKDQYSSLYNIARKKHIRIAQDFSTPPLNISFRRVLVGWGGVK